MNNLLFPKMGTQGTTIEEGDGTKITDMFDLLSSTTLTTMAVTRTRHKYARTDVLLPQMAYVRMIKTTVQCRLLLSKLTRWRRVPTLADDDTECHQPYERQDQKPRTIRAEVHT